MSTPALADSDGGTCRLQPCLGRGPGASGPLIGGRPGRAGCVDLRSDLSRRTGFAPALVRKNGPDLARRRAGGITMGYAEASLRPPGPGSRSPC